MLWTPKALEADREGRKSPPRKPATAERNAGRFSGTGKGTMADSREVMNIRQASQYLGVSPDTLYKYVGEQKIPAFKLGNRWRFKNRNWTSGWKRSQARWKRKARENPRRLPKLPGNRKGGH